ncbi:MAG: menaquinone biosynthesis protein [Sphingobacteriales bacterium]|nr:MAG: menaquinone biosynthesis protein [Sphingobacteriales bacterium]
MQAKIIISAVSYLNTKPFLFGLKKTGLIHNIDLQLEVPAKTADKLKNGLAHIGLVPVAVLPQLQHHKIITDFCIGSVGDVKTVALYSQVPLSEIRKIYLDYQSRTSVQLIRILSENYWKLTDIEFIPATKHYEHQINGTTAGVIIGDRTIEWAPKFNYQYDLSRAWYEFTGLPFVFASWVTITDLPDGFENSLNNAFRLGLNSIDEVVKLYHSDYNLDFDLHEYYTRFISYEFDQQKRNGLELFLSYLNKNSAVNTIPATKLVR